jgi:beta-glucosidase
MNYQDPLLPVDQRVADLLARMTLDEKIAQMSQREFGKLEIQDGRVTAESLESSFAGKSCGMLWADCGDEPLMNSIRWRDSQAYLRTKTRLGIPAFTGAECLHGVLALGSTIFPQSIALGASWNPPLVQEMGRVVAEEASAIGICQALSPLFDLARDPRSGRVEECYGECPTLAARLGVAFVKGMQGDDSSAGIGPDRVMCMAKHFAAYSVPNNGLNIGPVSLGEREFRSLHLPAFEAAIKEANIFAVMPAYSEVDGMPAHANRWLLTDVLRKEWGFKGYVYSDWGGVGMSADIHKVAADKAVAATLALEAGVDIEAPGPDCYPQLSDLVSSGKIPESLIDRAVSRVLRAKFMAGLFDDRRVIDPESIQKRVRTPTHVALSRRIGEECVILLKNDNSLLPLDADKLKSIAVIGPNAAQVQFGSYTWSKSNRHGVNVLTGLKDLVGDRVDIRYAKGCDLVGLSTEGFADAAAAAKGSDVAIVVIGDTSTVMGRESWDDPTVPWGGTVSEGFDVTDPVPPGVQQELVRAIHATGTPTIVVMLHGRPYSVPWMKLQIPAILSAFYPGEQQGHVIADILFGRVNPSGRLPVTVVQSAGHIPTVYDYKPSGRGFYHWPGSPEKPGRDYVFASPDPLWPFGFGLTYTTFGYDGLSIAAPAAGTSGAVRVRFTVANTGARAGREVAQVYFRDLVSSTTTPVMRLACFEKVALEPGETRTLEFAIPTEALALWNASMQRVVEPGEFEIMVGASAEDIRLRGTFRLIEG